MINILIVGSGGREHAMAWKIKQSPKLNQVFFAPGNAGTSLLGTNLTVGISDFEGLKRAVLDNQIDMVLVGPEIPLCQGLHDYFSTDDSLKNILFVGPHKHGAQLEGSKDFAKEFMMRHQIPTAKYLAVTTNNLNEGLSFLKIMNVPYVLKADGLAAGKGVLIVNELQEAEKSLKEMLDGQFGAASSKVVIEEFLSGIECSVFAITDGKDYRILPVAKDYKRIGEADTGLNTGGMGAISPVPFANVTFMQKVEDRIIRPTVQGLQEDHIPYNGFIFFGLISCNGEPMVIEYNVRMGDPETEAIMLRVKSDFVDLLIGAAEGSLADKTIEIDERFAVALMLVSGGYPGPYEKGKIIHGLGNIENSIAFHAGTVEKEGKIYTDGGRVLAISSYGQNMKEALSRSYQNAQLIEFEGKYFRKDLGFDLEK